MSPVKLTHSYTSYKVVRLTYIYILGVRLTHIYIPSTSTGNNVWASFLVHQVLHTSATVLRYCRMFMQFSVFECAIIPVVQ